MRKILIILILLSAWAVNAQTYEDSAYVNTSTSAWNGVDIRPASPASVIFRNNSITSVNADGYMLRAGDDLPAEGHVNYLDGAVISGNKLDWNGTPGSDNVHGIILGYSINYDIKYNYIDLPYLGLVFEGTEGMTYTSGGVYYNIIKKGRGSGIVLNGQNGVCVYNNTFYSSQANWSSSLIKVDLLTQVSPTATSNNIKIKNNIFYTVNHQAVISFADSCLTTLECDYNVYYAEDNDHTPAFFNITTSTYLTWAQWQALGFDAHSVVVNPNFLDTVNFVPSTRLDYGTDLGTNYDYGLNTTADWIVGVSPGTTIQGGTWQAGARTYESASAGSDAYYVSTTGSDAAAGTFAAPWLTWEHAFETATAGDTVYFRGGVYPTTVLDGTGIRYNPSSSIGNDGTAAEPIVYMNYPGEVPILDCSNTTSTSGTYYYTRGIWLQNLDYVTFRGLHIRNLNQIDYVDAEESSYDVVVGWECETGNNVTFDQCVAYNMEGIGFRARYSDTVAYINCDAYNNCDTLHTSLPGSYGTGFSTGGSDTTGIVSYTGCRAWQCGDQGFSSPWGATTIYDNCWSFNNGMMQGSGNGFKGSASSVTNPANLQYVHHIYRNCLAFYNGNPLPTKSGHNFTTNDQGVFGSNATFYNCVSYISDSYGFVSYTSTTSPTKIFNNNVSYGSPLSDLLQSGITTNTYNSWNGGVTVTTADFVSVDSTGVTGVRQADGSLPNLDFLKLVEGSDLIDAGTDVGLSFNGDAPDMGAYEYSDALSSATDILTFTIASQTGAATINTTNHTVAIEVAYTADITDLTPTITMSYGATINPLSGVSQNFTSPVTYTVTALDGTTTQEWVVTVTQAEEPAAPAGSSRIVKYRGLILKL